MATRAEWAEQVEEWKRSGLDAAEFARREGLQPAQFDRWRRELRAGQPRRAERRSPPMPVAKPAPPTPPALAPAPPAWIDIVLPSGGLVRLLPGVDAATLAYVLALAAELASGGSRRQHTCASPTSSSPGARK